MIAAISSRPCPPFAPSFPTSPTSATARLPITVHLTSRGRTGETLLFLVHLPRTPFAPIFLDRAPRPGDTVEPSRPGERVNMSDTRRKASLRSPAATPLAESGRRERTGKFSLARRKMREPIRAIRPQHGSAPCVYGLRTSHSSSLDTPNVPARHRNTGTGKGKPVVPHSTRLRLSFLLRASARYCRAECRQTKVNIPRLFCPHTAVCSFTRQPELTKALAWLDTGASYHPSLSLPPPLTADVFIFKRELREPGEERGRQFSERESEDRKAEREIRARARVTAVEAYSLYTMHTSYRTYEFQESFIIGRSWTSCRKEPLVDFLTLRVFVETSKLLKRYIYVQCIS